MRADPLDALEWYPCHDRDKGITPVNDILSSILGLLLPILSLKLKQACAFIFGEALHPPPGPTCGVIISGAKGYSGTA